MRNQLDMFERVSSKGVSDPVLEPLLATNPDPFSAYGPPRNDDQIFSILHHNSILGLGHSPDVSYDTDTPGSGHKSDGKGTSPAAEHTGVSSVLTPANLIMSPSTPSKGLSRVASGAASPMLNQDASTSASANGGNAAAATASGSNGGLGISLAAAVELARQPASKAAATQQQYVISEKNAELFGTDGEDDGGDEASIFSGTEDDQEGTGGASASNTDEKGGNGKAQLGMAARIMQEKKRRRENAVRASAKTRLKHALSTIDESKGTTGAAAMAAEGRTRTSSDDDKTITDVQTSGALGERDMNTESTSNDGHAKAKEGHSRKSSQVDSSQQEHDVDSVWS